MLVSAKEMLTKAKAGKYAVGQFNINNLEWTKAILLTAQECNSPVILGVSEGAGKYMCGFNTVAGMVNGMLKTLNITVPVALHLDHGSYDAALQAMEDGFSSVMFDGSHYGIEENIEKTKEIIRIANEKGISVEAEVGAIGGEEDGVIGGGEVADPDECKMIADLGVTMLAAGIGNIHGVYPENWQGLNFEVLAKIQEKTGTMPLVLQRTARTSRARASTPASCWLPAWRPSRRLSRRRWSCSALWARPKLPFPWQKPKRISRDGTVFRTVLFCVWHFFLYLGPAYGII